MKKPICPNCGSDHVTCTVGARWLPKSGRFSANYGHHDLWCCHECDKQGRKPCNDLTALWVNEDGTPAREPEVMLPHLPELRKWPST